jgi:hypothetical protein
MNLLEMLLSGGESEKTLQDSPPSPPSSPGTTCPNPIASPRAIAGLDLPDNCTSNLMCGLPELSSSDPYDQRMKLAWQQIIRADHVAGMVRWLGKADRALYVELTERLPGEIQRCWSEHASLRRFDDVLARFVEAHRTACDLYKAQFGNLRSVDE